MTTYIAFLRGIMPTNPNMKGERLREAFNALGFKNVATVIASGNVIFQSPSKSVAALAAKIENQLHKQLGFKSTTIIRTHDEIKALVKKDPFKGIKDEKPNYLIVTFFKNKQDGKSEVATVINLDDGKTPNFMAAAEKKYSKEITTRTWKTVHRVLKVMDSLAT